MQNKVELLAPAKDLESGTVAINAGADAVYIGAARFGARQAVGNSVGDIEKLAAYAHKYWARVYAAVNTLLHDSELDAAVQLCHQLHNAGVDAIIIQDMGLLESSLPPIPLFASTQMHNHTPERVLFLEQVGIQRVILARELSLGEIREIRKTTSIELETFIHGALCVSYSGQCALSYAIGGRSGNRGECAQPCRRRYSLINGKDNTLIEDRHLLSLKDLNLTEYLRDLLEVGIFSFKIEGRLKDQAYVRNIVAHYRTHLDSLLPDLGLRASSSGRVRFDFEPDPIKTFNRGYSTYFLTGNRDDITSFATPKHAGEPIGVVTSTDKNSFTFNVPSPLNNGDGIAYLDQDGILKGTHVNRSYGNIVFPANLEGIQRGVQICRNADRQYLKQLGKSQPDRRIPIMFKFSETDEGFQLSAEDKDGNYVFSPLIADKIPAHKPGQAIETLKRQLTRLGDSEFVCDEINIDLSNSYFFPVSSLNALRRDLVSKLLVERLRNYPRMIGGAIQNEVPYPETTLSFLGNVLNRRARSFYLRHGVQEIEPAAESGIDMHGRKVMTTKHCLKYELGGCHLQENPNHLDVPLYLIADDGLRLRLAFNCLDCLMDIYIETTGREPHSPIPSSE